MANDHLTLDEIAEQHDHMVEDIWRASRKYFFTTKKQAEAFRGGCVNAFMATYKAEWTPGMPSSVLDRKMAHQKLKIFEYRDGYPGIYMYADDELKGYVSIAVPHKSAFIHHKPNYMVRTNLTC